jgi:RecB family endonuclease NucS
MPPVHTKTSGSAKKSTNAWNTRSCYRASWYLERLRPALGAVRGVLAAQAFTQQARTSAAARGVNCVALDYDALRGMEPNTPTLF